VTALELVLGLHLVVEAEAWASACRLSGIGVWLGTGLDI
jgi:hypothetical protein